MEEKTVTTTEIQHILGFKIPALLIEELGVKPSFKSPMMTLWKVKDIPLIATLLAQQFAQIAAIQLSLQITSIQH
jgi:hypothetical protein